MDYQELVEQLQRLIDCHNRQLEFRPNETPKSFYAWLDEKAEIINFSNIDGLVESLGEVEKER